MDNLIVARGLPRRKASVVNMLLTFRCQATSPLVPRFDKVLGRIYMLRNLGQRWTPPRFSDDAEGFCYFSENVGGAKKLLALVRGADNSAKPRFSFGHGRVAHSG